MKVCLPVDRFDGLESRLADDLRAAPLMARVDTATHACEPLAAMGCGEVPEGVDALIVVGGLGRGRLLRLREAGVRVFAAPSGSVREALIGFSAGRLHEVLEAACGGGGHHAASSEASGCGCAGHASSSAHAHHRGGGCCGGH